MKKARAGWRGPRSKQAAYLWQQLAQSEQPVPQQSSAFLAESPEPAAEKPTAANAAATSRTSAMRDFFIFESIEVNV